MSRIRILVVKVDEADLDTLKPASALDDLEASAYEMGTAALKRVLQVRWEEIDKQLAQKSRQSFPPSLPKSRRTPKR